MADEVVLKELMSINSRLGKIEGQVAGIDEVKVDVSEIKSVIELHRDIPERVTRLENKETRRGGVLAGWIAGSGLSGAGITKLLDKWWG